MLLLQSHCPSIVIVAQLSHVLKIAIIGRGDFVRPHRNTLAPSIPWHSCTASSFTPENDRVSEIEEMLSVKSSLNNRVQGKYYERKRHFTIEYICVRKNGARLQHWPRS